MATNRGPLRRREVDASLRAITGRDPLAKLRASLAWKEAQAKERTKLVQNAWRAAWKTERARWEKAEQKRSAARRAISAKLELVRQGKLPATDQPCQR